MRPLALRHRITLASAVSTALILLTLSLFVYTRLQAELQRATDSALRARAAAIATSLGQRGIALADHPDSHLDGLTQILTASGRVVAWSGSSAPQVPAATLRELRGPAFLPGAPPPGGQDQLRLLALPVNEHGRLVIVVGASPAGMHRTLGDLRLLLLVSDPAALALACLATWLLTGAALRPVERMRREAAAISVSDPSRRLPVSAADDEIARLGRTLNSLLDRLHNALERERRLLGDASHELRTPLGTLKAELDLALSRARTAQELEATLHSASEETDRLARLAQDLLVLSRAREDGLRICRVPTDLGELVERTCARHRPRAAQHGCWIECAAQDASVEVDPMRLAQALENLLDNAVRHADGGGLIRVEASARAGILRLTVANAGPGFSPDVLPRVFEPFVTAGTEGSAAPGAGLGLAIVQAVARSHGGAAAAQNIPGGARVTMTLELGAMPGRQADPADPADPEPAGTRR